MHNLYWKDEAGIQRKVLEKSAGFRFHIRIETIVFYTEGFTEGEGRQLWWLRNMFKVKCKCKDFKEFSGDFTKLEHNIC